MVHAVLIGLAAMLLSALLAAAFLLGRHLRRRTESGQDLSPVTRQHIDLFQGGQLSETAVESAKAEFRELLERGEVEAVEASLRPGTHFVVQVRALAELGTDDAGRILERQLQRHLTSNAIEQSWYWIDLANGLRNLNREESLPHLLRCADSNSDHPLSHFFAAETVCFLSFAGYMRQPETPLGDAALRVLHRALEGLRCGLQPQVVAEARLGELIEELWDYRPDRIHPLVVRVFAEALRVLRRAPHAEIVLAEEKSEQEAFSWQMSHLASLESVLVDYLEEAPRQLCEDLPKASTAMQRDILVALNDLRADAASVLLPVLADPKFPHADLAVAVLTWSRDPGVAPWLREWVHRRMPLVRQSAGMRSFLPGRKQAVPKDLPLQAILRTLRGHPSAETESFLLQAAQTCDVACRVAALSSLGWWEPCARDHVARCLQQARRDANSEIRHAARAALARLGEIAALQWFRQALTGQDSQRVHDTIQTVATEGIMLLWPDLDRLADTESVDVALHACEALERLREEMTSHPV